MPPWSLAAWSTRAALAFTLSAGRKWITSSREGVQLADFEGVQVVCLPNDDTVLTVYRNHDFRRLRPALGRRGRRPAQAPNGGGRYRGYLSLHIQTRV